MEVNKNCIFIQNRKQNVHQEQVGTIAMPNQGPFKPPVSGLQDISAVITEPNLPWMEQETTIATPQEVEAGINYYNPSYHIGDATISQITALDEAIATGNASRNYKGSLEITWREAIHINSIVHITALGSVDPVTSHMIEWTTRQKNYEYELGDAEVVIIDAHKANLYGKLERGYKGLVQVTFN